MLAGCGNASQHLSMGPWEEVGQAQSPIAGEQSVFEVTTLVPGDGPVVRPGDLVKAKVTVTTVDNQGRTRDPSPPHVIWVWTGRTPQPVTGQDVSTYGTLGGAHDSDLSSPTMLMDWSDSYAELRPPDQHPEEWQSP